MKKIFLIAISSVSLFANAQTIPALPNASDTSSDCSNIKLSTYISGIDAWARFTVFDYLKFPALKRKEEHKLVAYSPEGFLDLLHKLTDINSDGTSYDGLRIYFAIKTKDIDPESDKLTLIFVPTTSSTYHTDDINHCWIIKDKNAVPITRQKASEWVNNYMTYRMPDLEKNGRLATFNKNFMETRSLWYDMNLIQHSDETPGMIDYLQCLVEHHKIDKVIVKFGAFLKKFPYQLTLIFNFHGVKKTDNFITLYHEDLSTLQLSSANGDTGVPCPPYPEGQHSCSGSMLP